MLINGINDKKLLKKIFLSEKDPTMINKNVCHAIGK